MIHAIRSSRPVAFALHVMRAAKALATDKSLPRWLRLVLVVACLPIPGPVDNAVQVAVLIIVAVWFRPALVSAWIGTRR